MRKCRQHRNPVFHMALRNLMRKKKNTCMILLSFTVGSIAFLVLSQFFEIIDPKQYVDRYYEYDIGITDQLEEGSGITGAVVDRLNQLPEIETLETIERQTIHLEYDGAVYARYLKAFEEKSGMETGAFTQEQLARQFWTYAYVQPDPGGQEQKAGTVFLSEEYRELLPKGTKITAVDGRGKDHTLSVEGYVAKEDVQPAGGMAPELYLPKALKPELTGDWNISRIRIMSVPGGEEALLQKIKNVLPSVGVELESKAEWKHKLTKNMNVFYVVMGGLALILLCNGILNFINTMYGKVQEREKEFHILTSLGMTDRQIASMLRKEGMLYAGIISILVIAIESAGAKLMFYGIVEIAPYAVFRFPFMQLLILVAMVFAICNMVPVSAFKSVRK